MGADRLVLRAIPITEPTHAQAPQRSEVSHQKVVDAHKNVMYICILKVSDLVCVGFGRCACAHMMCDLKCVQYKYGGVYVAMALPVHRFLVREAKEKVTSFWM